MKKLCKRLIENAASLNDGRVGGIFCYIILFTSFFAFIDQGIISVVIIESWKELAVVVTLIFIATWITDLFFNRNNTEAEAVQVPFWGYMIGNYIFIFIEQYIKRHGLIYNQIDFFMLYTVCVAAFAMTMLSEFIHLTYKNQANVNVKILYVVIPIVGLLFFILYNCKYRMYL